MAIQALSQPASKGPFATALENENSLATYNSKSIDVTTSESSAHDHMSPYLSLHKNAKRFRNWLLTFGKFLGPGTIISVAYVDPDNFQTALTSGAQFEFKLLVMILLSNLIAIYLQVSVLKAKRCDV